MKPTITLRLLTLVLVPFTAVQVIHAQDDARDLRTLFGQGREIEHGGWGGPSTHFTSIMGHEALLVGARGGWLIDHGVTIGIAGHGLVTDVPNRDYDAYRSAAGDSLRRGSLFRMGYGGLLIEPIIAPKSPVHVSLPVIIGAGGCGYQTFHRRHDEFDPFTYSDDFQAFFVVEPGIELELNVIKLVRVGLGASYRYTTDLDLPETPKDALRGFNAGVTVKVGRF
ncbi:MAG TPA: hypothetical protein PKJ19_05660 [Flavobacteriales bacterium]|nr:hypothetical protein [Flavobacteriales bacterium]HNU57555.1 hypothetical protein [Flavobacteriales bacterium]